MELDYKALGARIAQRRKLMHIPQKVLAEKVNTSNNHLSGVENGTQKPSLGLFVSICIALHVTPDYLLVGNMYSSNVSQNIVDNLRLCSNEDIDLIYNITKYLVERRSKTWNDDNFI